VFYPEAFDWSALQPENRRHNFTLAFHKAEELADIYPLLEVEDMVRFKKPDWKCVFTYVQSFYRRFRDGRSPPKTGPTIPSQTQATLSAVAMAVAESQQAEERGKQMVEQITRNENTMKTLANVKVAELSTTSKCVEEEKKTPSTPQSITKLPTNKTLEDQGMAGTPSKTPQTSDHPHMLKQLSAPADISSEESDHSKTLKTNKQEEKSLSSDNQTPDKPCNELTPDKPCDNLTPDKPTPDKPGNNLTHDMPCNNLTSDKPANNLTSDRPGDNLTPHNSGDEQKPDPSKELLESDRPKDENLPDKHTAAEDTKQVPTQSMVNDDNDIKVELAFKEFKAIDQDDKLAHDNTGKEGAVKKEVDTDNQEVKDKLHKDSENKTGRREKEIPDREGLERKERKYSLNHPPPSTPPPPVSFHI